jgi:hypothetical protein
MRVEKKEPPTQLIEDPEIVGKKADISRQVWLW